MIAIVDYGAGNLVSVKKALDWLGQECAITSHPAQVAKATKIVLPGVGNFASTAALARTGLQEAIADSIGQGFRFSASASACSGCLNAVKNRQRHRAWACWPVNASIFQPVKSPHVGWNQLTVDASSRLLRGVPSSSFVSLHALFVRR
jgi:glutamine amidotransferase